MNRQDVAQELETMRAQSAHLEAAEADRARVEQLLGVLDRAALAMGGALTQESVFDALAGELRKLGLACMLFPLDEERANLNTTYLSHELRLLDAAEKLANLRQSVHSLPVDSLLKVELYRRVTQARETILVQDFEEPVREALPGGVRAVAGQIVKLLKLNRAAVAPLLVAGEVIGLFVIQSDDLTQDDLPAVTAFAHQVASAWHKAELYQQVQSELAERTRRDQLLRTLNEAALAMGWAFTRDEVFDTLTRVLRQLGFLCMIFPTDESLEHLYPTYLGYDSGVIEAAEKLAGLSRKGFVIRIKDAPHYRRPVRERETVFATDLEEAMRRVLPRAAKRLARHLVKLLRMYRMILAPLIAEDKVMGLLLVQSDDLTEEDAPAVTAFAHQVAAAWHKARLYEEAQHEIAERLRAEEELRQLKEFNEGIVQNMAEGVVVQDAQGVLTFVNPAGVELMGYPPEELVGQDGLLPIPADQRPIAQAANERRERGGSDRYELELMRKDGTRVPVLVSGSPRYDPVDGRWIGSLAVFTDLSEQRRAADELVASNRLLQTILDTIPDAIISVDTQNRILSCNRSVERVLGYTPDELVGQSYLSIVAEQMLRDPEQPRRQAQLLETGFLEQEEFAFRRKSGDVIPASFSVGLIRGEQQEIVGQVGSMRDITRQKRAERQWHALNQAARAMREALTPDEIFAAVATELQKLGLACVLFPFDPGQACFRVTYMSYDQSLLRVVERLAKISSSDFTIPVSSIEGLGLYDQVVRQRRTALVPDLAEVMRKFLPGPVGSVARQVVEALGVSRGIVSPLVVEEGLIGILMVQSDDLTEADVPPVTAFAHQVATAWRKAELLEQARLEIAERIRAEEEREELLAQIQAQARQMQVTIDSVPEGVLLLNAEHKVVLANPVAEDYLDVPQAGTGPLTHLGGHSLTTLLTASRQEVSAGGRTLEVAARPIVVGPTTGGWVLVMRDVTEEREIQRSMQQRERLAAVGQLAAGIAHDFNNIMAVIVLYSQMSLRVEELPSKIADRLNVIVQQASRATELIQQILDFGRKAVLERQPLDLVSLLRDEVNLLDRTLPENIQVRFSHGPGEYTVDADPARIQQAIMNLAFNARDAMPEGGELDFGLDRILVKAGTRPPLPEMEPGDWVQFTISDSGAGIPSAVLPHIFEPFFTTKAAGAGSGLGLAQVYGIVRQHGGAIGVTTAEGKGTSFELYLPSLPATESGLSGADLKRLVSGTGQLILVVEDHPTTRRALVAALQELNYGALEAANGEEALVAFDRHRSEIAMVMTDLVMPGIGGRALLQILKERDPEVKVMVLTGYPLDGSLEGLDGIEWLQKPVAVDHLSQVLAHALREGPDPKLKAPS